MQRNMPFNKHYILQLERAVCMNPPGYGSVHTSSFFAIFSALFLAIDLVLRRVPRTSATCSFSNFCRSSGVSLFNLRRFIKVRKHIISYPMIERLFLIPGFLLKGVACFSTSAVLSSWDSVLANPPPSSGLPGRKRELLREEPKIIMLYATFL